MKNEIFVALTVALAIALGMQTFTNYRLRDRISQLSTQINLTVDPQTEIFKLPMLKLSPDCGDGSIKSRIESF